MFFKICYLGCWISEISKTTERRYFIQMFYKHIFETLKNSKKITKDTFFVDFLDNKNTENIPLCELSANCYTEGTSHFAKNDPFLDVSGGSNEASFWSNLSYTKVFTVDLKFNNLMFSVTFCEGYIVIHKK